MGRTRRSSGKIGSSSLQSEAARQLIDKLREHGLDKHIDLPQVAIMGDTSSGKSSVLSALSGITFPSSSELTTRCPTQLILTYAEEFSGTVTLKRYGSNTKTTPTRISSKAEITTQIERLTQQLVDEGQHISDDSIVIDVSGPEFPNLTLIDLPGIVRTVETGEDKSIIQRIEALVKRYLNQSRTVILAVVPANVDVHNSEILQHAEDVDPDGDRTQAIITKLDLIDEGAEKAVVELLLNKRKKLKLGYHAVRCRGQKELNDGLSIEDGLEKEQLFFQTSKIWGHGIPSSLKGISTLRSKLVTLLEDTIIRELPKVIQEIDDKMSMVQEKLIRLGEPMDSEGKRRAYYSRSIEFYYIRMESAVKGTYTVGDFFHKACKDQDDARFRALVRKQEALFQKEVSSRIHELDYIEVNAEDLKIGETVYIVGAGVKQVEAKPVQGAVHATSKSHVSICNQDGEIELFHSNFNVFRVRSLDKIKEMIASNRGDELGIFASDQVFCAIVQTYVDSWEVPSMQLFQFYRSTLSRVSELAIQGLQCKSTIQNYVQTTMSRIFMELREKVVQLLQDKLESERRPYTLNHYLFDSLIKQRNKSLLDAIDALDNPKGSKVDISTVPAILKNHGVGRDSNEDHVALETEYAVVAYLKVASKRFIDEIPILLHDHLLKPFIKLAKERLNVTDEILARMLAESPRIVLERKEILEEQKALRASKEEVLRMHY